MKNIYEALHRIANDIQFVEKTGNNEFNNYSYASELDLLMAVRPIMMDYNVICLPVDVQTFSSPDAIKTEAVVTYRFVHVSSGEHIDVKVAAAGSDKGDKGAFKLMTGALKYALRQTFLIATGDDPEAYDPDSGKKTGRNDQSVHPVEKLISIAESIGYNIVSDPMFQKVWNALNIDILNMSSSSRDMKITMEIKDLVKILRDQKPNSDDLKKILTDFAGKVKQI